MGRSAIWCGSGCQWFLKLSDIGDKKKLTEPKGGNGLNSYRHSFVAKVAWALKRGKWPQKGGDLGPNVPRNGPISPQSGARFELSPVHHAIRAHTQEPCPNDKTLPILLASFTCEGICRKSRRTLFFLRLHTDFWNVNFGRIRQKAAVLIFWYHFFVSYLFFYY